MIKNISNLGDAALYCDFGEEVSKEINSSVINYFNFRITEYLKIFKSCKYGIKFISKSLSKYLL